jgi:hypothetical protein
MRPFEQLIFFFGTLIGGYILGRLDNQEAAQKKKGGDKDGR